MSCEGTMIGLPFDGLKMLLVDIMRTRASSCASRLSGTCTAIWSPSKSALKAAQTNGCSWIALPSMSIGSNAWMPRRCNVGARLSSTGVLADDLFKDVPHLGSLLLYHFFRHLDGRSHALELELRVDERFKQFERHLLRQAALVQLQFGSDDDHGTARIVDPLAEQVLAEAPLLALEHVGQRLQGPPVRTGNDPGAPAVVEQGVDRFLEHAFLVAHDDIRRAQLDEPLQSVVAVDDAAVEVVEIGGGETAAVERNERPQVRREDRDDREDHPFRPVARFKKRFDDLEALDELLGAR